MEHSIQRISCTSRFGGFRSRSNPEPLSSRWFRRPFGFDSRPMPLSQIARVCSITILIALSFLAAGARTSLASISCNGSCDSVAIVDSTESHNGTGVSCVTLHVMNRNLDGGSIFAYRIVTPYNNPGFLCNINSGPLTGDPAYTWEYNTTWFENPDSATSNSRYFWDSSRHEAGYPDTASLLPCDSAWINVCLCCGIGYYDEPFYVITYHWALVGGKWKIDSCISDLFNPDWFSDACGGTGTYQCSDNCDQLSVGTPFTDAAGETRMCVTITRRRVGSLTGFTLYWKWPAGCHKDRWRLVSAPSGWSETGNTTDSSSYIGDGYFDVINNCESATFCFALDSCETLCDHFTVGLHSSDDEPYFCNPTQTVYLSKAQQIDHDCCAISGGGSEATWTTPTQDTTTGIWSFCMAIHRTDTYSFNKVCINTNCNGLGRCVEVSGVPYGWHYDASSGCYLRDSALNTGCRTFEWCFQTCDCQTAMAFVNKICINGDTTFSFLAPFGPDTGTCCNGVWHHNDYVEIKGLSPNCIKVTYHNTRYRPAGCCNDDALTFTLPPGCHVTSITVPAPWAADTSGGIVSIHDSADRTTARLACCDSLSVTICTDCPIGQTSWTTNWSSTDTCGDHWVGVITYNAPGLKGSIPQGRTPQGLNMPSGEQNFPNPFGAETGFETTIPFETSGTGTAFIRVMDQTGHVIMKDNEAVTYAGKHFFYFTGKELPSGTYYYQIEFPNGVVIVNRTMILVK